MTAILNHRIEGLSTLLGVAFPLALCGLCLVEPLRNTPPVPAVCADFTFAAFAISSEIIPLLRKNSVRSMRRAS